MSQEILELKKLNAAYIAALEYDYCPQPKKAKEVDNMFVTGVTLAQLEQALAENNGLRPDEIASSISDKIKELD